MKHTILVAMAGLLALQSTAQNVGIGTTAPTEAKLVVTGGDYGSQAVFGKGVNGIAIESGPAAINFNHFYSEGFRKLLSGGYTSKLVYNSGAGSLAYNTSTVSGTANAIVDVTKNLLTITRDGNVGIVFANPTATLTVGRGSSIGGTARFDGTTNASHFNINATEDTYIRGGINGSSVFINDQAAAGNVIIVPNSGNVGIGIATPSTKLDVNGRIRIRQTGVTAGVGFDGKDVSNNTQIDRGFIGMANNNYVGFYGGSGAGWGMAMNVGTGNVGIGTTTPANRLTVKDNQAFTPAAEIVQDGVGGGLWVTSNGPSWATLTAVNNSTGAAIRTSGRVAINAAAPTSTLHVGGSLTMPVKVINDNYTATADDYSIHFIPTSAKGQLKTLTLPPAGGCTGRIYFISAALPFYRGAPEPSLLFIKDAAGNNIIANSAYNDAAEDGINALVHFKKDWGGGNTAPARRKLWITVQSTGSTWVILGMDYYSE